MNLEITDEDLRLRLHIIVGAIQKVIDHTRVNEKSEMLTSPSVRRQVHPLLLVIGQFRIKDELVQIFRDASFINLERSRQPACLLREVLLVWHHHLPKPELAACCVDNPFLFALG